MDSILSDINKKIFQPREAFAFQEYFCVVQVRGKSSALKNI